MPAERVGRRTALVALLATGAAAGAAAAPSHAAAPPGHAAAAHRARPGAPVAAFGAAPAARWVRTADDVAALQGLTPPAAARLHALACLAAYEALLPGMPRHRSLAGQLAGLGPLPEPRHRAVLDWPLALAAATCGVLRALLPDGSLAAGAVLDAAEAAEVADRRRAGATPAAELASSAHGRAVAGAVARWAAGDGHAQALRRSYAPPVGEWWWVPTAPRARAAEPHLEQVRPMLLRAAAEVVPAAPLPASAQPDAALHAQAVELVALGRRTTEDQRALARSWADAPRSAGTLAGHWLHLAAQAAEQHRLGLDLTVEALVRTGVALHDGLLSCWTWKYRHDLLRPVTYVHRHLDPAWSPAVRTPQSPGHPSGHAVGSRAAAAVLTRLLGPLRVVDTARPDAPGAAARTYASFAEAADAAAASRLHGGVQFRHGVDAGSAQGDEVGALVLTRLLTTAGPRGR